MLSSNRKDSFNVTADKTSGSIFAQAMIWAGLVSEWIAMDRPKTKQTILILQTKGISWLTGVGTS